MTEEQDVQEHAKHAQCVSSVMLHATFNQSYNRAGPPPVLLDLGK